MAICRMQHLIVRNKKVIGLKEHYYIAGNCIHNPMNQGGFESFLRATFPYYHSKDYEASKSHCDVVVPSC